MHQVKMSRLFLDDKLYERSYKGKSVLVVCSFADHEIKWRLPKAYAGKKGKLVICNYRSHDLRTLKPYEARVYEIKQAGRS